MTSAPALPYQQITLRSDSLLISKYARPFPTKRTDGWPTSPPSFSRPNNNGHYSTQKLRLPIVDSRTACSIRGFSSKITAADGDGQLHNHHSSNALNWRKREIQSLHCSEMKLNELPESKSSISIQKAFTIATPNCLTNAHTISANHRYRLSSSMYPTHLSSFH